MLTDEGKRVGSGQEREAKVLDLVVRNLAEARRRHARGTITIEIEVHDGGITHCYVAPRFKEI